MSCPHCGEDARFVEYRQTGAKCLLGEIVYERAYYHCRHCHRGWFPTDEELGIERKQTSGAREVITLVGTLEPFEQGGQRVLGRLTGLAVSGSTVRRTTEATGEDVAGRRTAGETFGPERSWDWHRDATGNRVGYVSLDATGVRQQGPHAEEAEGRMAWVGCVFNPQPTPLKATPPAIRERRYVSGLMSLEEVGAQLRRECRAVDLSQADVVVALTDGGNGLQDCLIDVLAGLARDPVFILDFYHAREHLVEFAQAWIPQDEQRSEQVDAWCHTLKHQGGEALLSELEALDVSECTARVQEEHRLLTGYFRSNLHRTDYPTYRARGWQIGSGMIEAACKTVVGQRLKESGMRWRPPGTTALCQLRALYKSQPELWDHYWARTSA